MPEGGRESGYRHAQGRVCTGILCLKCFYLVCKGGSIRGVPGEGLNGICSSFPGVFFSVLMHRNEHTGEFGIILWAASLPYFYLGFVWL